MNLRSKMLLATGVMAAATMFAATASAQMYAFGSGKQGSFTYSASAAIAKVAADHGMNLRLKPFGGQSAFVPGINAGEVQFGIANELDAHYAVTGEAIYKGKPQKNLRVLIRASRCPPISRANACRPAMSAKRCSVSSPKPC
jgi:TRAP-type uncharacterized transport system substrate-binding protein